MQMRTFGVKFSSIAVRNIATEGKQKTVIAQGVPEDPFGPYKPSICPYMGLVVALQTSRWLENQVIFKEKN